jgi:hypothetical protein
MATVMGLGGTIRARRLGGLYTPAVLRLRMGPDLLSKSERFLARSAAVLNNLASGAAEGGRDPANGRILQEKVPPDCESGRLVGVARNGYSARLYRTAWIR